MPKTMKKNNEPQLSKKDVGLRSRALKDVSRALGTKDLLGDDFSNLEAVKMSLIDFFKRYGFTEMETPILEKAEMFKNNFRRDASKELYEITSDKGEKLALRSELTQGIIRAFFEHDLINSMPQPTRLFSVGPVFRQEKLQSSRYRQFTQINAEILGENKAVAEALLIYTMFSLCKEWGLDIEVQINSLGKSECQKEYKTRLNAYYKERGNRAKLCNECKKLLAKDPLALLDCTEKECMGLAEGAPQIVDFLDEESRDHFSKLVEYLDELEVKYNFNPRLVRGLNYYNDAVFEFWPIADNGQVQYKYALGGGGRYDKLIEKIGGQDVPAVGMALGMERILYKLKDKGLILFPQPENLIFLAQLSEQAKLKSMQIFEDLRREGFNIRNSFAANSLKKQLEEAKQLQARVCLILGKKELSDDTILLRDMDSGVQEIVPQKKLIKDLQKKLN
ncbi:MAG: histidine--tRNA ligase [Candidatus Pacebacteria bacterium]|nr:histidine--tRNA ligase [Candidatus Paceibacterota bacterium]